MAINRLITCPICKKESRENEFLPFCSSRCQLLDLGSWANESYKVSRPVTDEENEDENRRAEEDY